MSAEEKRKQKKPRPPVTFRRVLETLFMISLLALATYYFMVWITPTTDVATDFLWGYMGFNVVVVIIAILIKIIIDGIKKLISNE